MGIDLQVLALIGDQLDYGENICGAVLSIRFNEDILSVWNRNASDHQVRFNNYNLVLFSSYAKDWGKNHKNTICLKFAQNPFV